MENNMTTNSFPRTQFKNTAQIKLKLLEYASSRDKEVMAFGLNLYLSLLGLETILNFYSIQTW